MNALLFFPILAWDSPVLRWRWASEPSLALPSLSRTGGMRSPSSRRSSRRPYQELLTDSTCRLWTFHQVSISTMDINTMYVDISLIVVFIGAWSTFVRRTRWRIHPVWCSLVQYSLWTSSSLDMQMWEVLKWMWCCKWTRDVAGSHETLKACVPTFVIFTFAVREPVLV